ncbi:MAG: hypothetical protein EBS29_04615 [Chloroflexia bacterium]|nr:hypothetical protein [Chloroflexia bacterium]
MDRLEKGLQGDLSLFEFGLTLLVDAFQLLLRKGQEVFAVLPHGVGSKSAECLRKPLLGIGKSGFLLKKTTLALGGLRLERSDLGLEPRSVAAQRLQLDVPLGEFGILRVYLARTLFQGCDARLGIRKCLTACLLFFARPNQRALRQKEKAKSDQDRAEKKP